MENNGGLMQCYSCKLVLPNRLPNSLMVKDFFCSFFCMVFDKWGSLFNKLSMYKWHLSGYLLTFIHSELLA